MPYKIARKSQDISGWYNDVIEAAKLAEHSPVKGTMVFRPRGFALWETVQKNMDVMIKGLGVENAYFPLFIPYSFLEKEKEHVQGFSPELAVVTHAGGEKLSEPLVVRPTSETIIYDAFSRWIQSFRDLPLKLNQWNNVVRWEKRPYLFLRTTEFLWQEGHTVHETNEEAQKMVEDALSMYVKFYQDYFALFGYAGVKSESEKFPGAEKTYTYEMLMPDGKVIQGCTSHNLGQNFAKVFNITFQDQGGKVQYPYQTSWGFSTRSIGALILAHGDDNGLVLPPEVAPLQAVIIPIKTKQADAEGVNDLARKVFEILESYNYKVRIDDSNNSPGWKFNEYELIGVPLRIEIGPSEARSKEVSISLRDSGQKLTANLENLPHRVGEAMHNMQTNLLAKHQRFTKENTRVAESYAEFKNIMGTTRGFIKAFWCESPACEATIKGETKATTRCLPLNSPKMEGKCIYCGQTAKHIWLFGQSY